MAMNVSVYESLRVRRTWSVPVLSVATLGLVIASSAAAQDRPLTPSIQADLMPGASQGYAVSARAGDLVVGPLAIASGGPLKFEVFDPRQTKFKAAEYGGRGGMKIGFVAPVHGTYRVQFTAGGKDLASFSWTTTVASPAERMAGVHLDPLISYESPRIARLAKDVAAGVPNALAQFWAEAAAGGGPLVEPMPAVGGRGRGAGAGAGQEAGGPSPAEDVLVTFLWRETYETYSVEVVRPPGGPTNYRLMTRLPGTDVWFKTMKMHRTSRFEYGLAPNRRGPDEDGDVTVLLDPLNPRVFPEDRDQWIARAAIESDPAAAWGSVLSLPDAPDESWVRRTPTRRGTLTPKTFESPSLQARLNMYIYTPPDYSPTAGPYPLLILFDGPAYATGIIAAPTTLDNLIVDGRIPPTMAVFVSSMTRSLTGVASNRASTLSNPTFLDAVAVELLPWLRSSYAIRADPRDVVIGGSSAGAVAGARAALQHPTVFGNVLALSGGAAMSELYITTPRVPVRFFLSVGLYELADDLPFDQMVITESHTLRNRRFRDILRAKGYDVTYHETGGNHSYMQWRAMLAEGLMTLLGHQAPR